MYLINWYALNKPKPCVICSKPGKHTTTVACEVLCDRHAIIVNKSKYLTTARKFFRNTLWGWIENEYNNKR